MSVCEHDPYCLGSGPDHVRATTKRLSIFSPEVETPGRSRKPNKRRKLSGKNERQPRKEK